MKLFIAITFALIILGSLQLGHRRQWGGWYEAKIEDCVEITNSDYTTNVGDVDFAFSLKRECLGKAEKILHQHTDKWFWEDGSTEPFYATYYVRGQIKLLKEERK